MLLRLLVSLAAVASTAAAAQHHPPQTPAAPGAKPASLQESLLYQSAFKTYRTFRVDEPLLDWRAVNNEVEGLGGHGGHLRGLAPPRTMPDSQKDAPRQDSTPAGHAGHARKMPAEAAPAGSKPGAGSKPLEERK